MTGASYYMSANLEWKKPPQTAQKPISKGPSTSNAETPKSNIRTHSTCDTKLTEKVIEEVPASSVIGMKKDFQDFITMQLRAPSRLFTGPVRADAAPSARFFSVGDSSYACAPSPPPPNLQIADPLTKDKSRCFQQNVKG